MKTYIIAEAGVNHNGSLVIAKKLIDAGVAAGVDAVKFQTFIPEMLTSSTAQMAEYQKKNTGTDDLQLNMLRNLVLSQQDHYELLNYCREEGLHFCSSAFDLTSVDFLRELKLPFWKIPSGEITNYPYLKKIAQYKTEIIMSTGMSTLAEIEDAVGVLTDNGTDRRKLTLLHCNTEYPTPSKDVNLKVMQTLRQAFDVNVGFSDHTVGIEFPIAAVALGASVIEKHITIDKAMNGPDHRASLEPGELKAMVTAIRNIEDGIGSSIKVRTPSEKKNVGIARKSITAICNIRKGEMLTEDNLTTKRPGTGLSPMVWKNVIGQTAKRDYQKDEMLDLR